MAQVMLGAVSNVLQALDFSVHRCFSEGGAIVTNDAGGHFVGNVVNPLLFWGVFRLVLLGK